jgi:transcriptional regulator with XRE-family HTH domain
MEYQPLQLFGQRLVELRKAQGWSQERLALESGLARSYVGGIERGQRNLALINICILAEALDVSPSEMLNFFPQKNLPKKPESRKTSTKSTY